MIEQEQKNTTPPMLNMHRQGMLAKLLAKENLRIQHGNYATAFFDTKARVLGLPRWKTQDKDIYDLLIGHEVGHALYTPMKGIETFRRELPDVPFDICNIVEDIRIERMIQATYPGLSFIFRRAYEALVRDNFFGTKGKNLAKLNFADRLNLHAKAGKAIDVALTVDEQAIYDRCLAAKDFDEVIQICKDIAHLVKKQKQKDEESAGVSDIEKSKNMTDEPKESPMPPGGDETKVSSDESENSQISSSKDENEKKAIDTIGDTKGAEHALKEELTSMTAKEFDHALSQMQDNNNVSTFVEPTAQIIAKTIISYKEILASRKSNTGYDSFLNNAVVKAAYLKNRAATRKYVAQLVREFEMRKAATQYSRATVAKTGMLNMSRLHSYRYSEDIFRSITKLADAKSHGMMMFIDYSGSMLEAMAGVLEQTVNLVMFCRALNIPFDVYAFTTGVTREDSTYFPAHGEINIGDTRLLHTFSSRMSKNEFDTAIEETFGQIFYYQNRHSYTFFNTHGLINDLKNTLFARTEVMNGTPLQETYVIAHHLVTEFRKANSIQKMNVVVISDGDGAPLKRHMTHNTENSSIRNDTYGYAHGYENCISGMLNKQYVELNGVNNDTRLIDNLRRTTGATIIGFYIPVSAHAGVRKAGRALNHTRTCSNSDINDYKKEYRKNDSIIIPGGYAFDQYYVLGGSRAMDIDDDSSFGDICEDFDVMSPKSTRKLATSFAEFNSDKRSKRIILSKFAEVIS